ncbi:MAG: hypothetical protein DRI46_06455 [Chloroflexi bacterium]|nr:MAG: hypothetical protein DRI46_06455 [Chloroflexota bacterium]
MRCGIVWLISWFTWRRGKWIFRIVCFTKRGWTGWGRSKVCYTVKEKKRKNMITKERALELLHENIKNTNLRKHHYGVAAAMKKLAEELEGNPEIWEIVGLLHDADYEKTKDQMEQHTLLLAEILEEEDISGEIIRSIQSHASEYSGINPSTLMDYALLSCDDLTGLIVAVALVHPGKIAAVTVDSVLKKFSAKSFAASVNREKILKCESNLDIPLDKFVGLVLEAMQGEAELLGL